jgi:ribosomal protein S18 acetylase RimI-like enzyme
MPIEIRPVDAADVERLVDIAVCAWEPVHQSMASVLGLDLNRLVYPDWAKSQAAQVRSACTDPAMQVFVAAAGDVVLGFVSVLIDATDRSAEIDMIAVDPSAQRGGVGRALTDRAMQAMRDAGCTLAHVATGGDAGHAPARGLYDAAGFTGLPLVHYYREL